MVNIRRHYSGGVVLYEVFEIQGRRFICEHYVESETEIGVALDKFIDVAAAALDKKKKQLEQEKTHVRELEQRTDHPQG